MRKIYFRWLSSCLALFVFQPAFAQLVISQVYGGGGNSGATYRNDYIELFNPGNSAVDLTGWSVQYASAAGSSWQVTPLSGSVAPGQYFLVQEAAGSGGTTDLPTPDVTGSIPMSATAGKVALVNTTTALSGTCPTGYIDLVGFGGTASCFEGSGSSPAPSNTLAIFRGNNGCTDNNSNDLDFTTAPPSPRYSASPVNLCSGCTPPDNQPTALSLTAAPHSISGSFTPASAGAVSADNYLILIGTSATLSQLPVSGTLYATGAMIGDAVVAGYSNTGSFSIDELESATDHFIFIYSLSNSGACYNTSMPLTGMTTTTGTPAPTVSVEGTTNAAEPSTNGSFLITLSSPAPVGGVSISYSLGGSAAENADYTDPQNGSLHIPEGASNGTIILSILDDNLPEPPKTISLTINSADAGYIIATASASIELADNDAAEAISLQNIYAQDFDALANSGTGIPWTDNSTLPGWYASRTVYNTATGSSNAGALYSFGASGSTDRALGSIGSGSTGTIYYGARFVNNSGGAIQSLKISYTGEQWRNGGASAVQAVNFAYQTASVVNSLTNGTWTLVPELTFNSPVIGGSATALDGNSTDNSSMVSYVIHGLNLPPGEEIMIRWEDVDHSGADHGLAIDNLTVEANPQDSEPPLIVSLSPATGATGIPTNTVLSATFNEPVSKSNGTILIRRVSDQVVIQSLPISDNEVVVSANSLSWNLQGLTANTAYSVEISGGALADAAGNEFAGISGTEWTFTTGIVFYSAGFNACQSSLTDGFSQYSVTGDITWACTAFGRDPDAPAGTAPFPNAVQINGFAGGTNVPNTDWLISPSFNLSSTEYPLLSFWSRTAFNGLPLVLKVSTNYTGGDPALATWTTINGRFPAQTSNTWTLSSNINLSAFKEANVHIAFVYTSSEDEGARWTLDDLQIANSPEPPPPSLTLSTSDLSFNYVASGATGEKTFGFTGNDLTSGISLSATGDFLLSKDGSVFSTSLVYSQAEANNLEQSVFVRFAPSEAARNFTGSINFAMDDTTAVVTLTGTSIDPATTLEVVNWNIEWFGSTEQDPANDDQQEANIRTILQNVGADIFALAEVVSEERLASVVSQMPGYAYVISNYGSHTNTSVNPPSALSQAQKLAFVYKTSIFSNISTMPLLSQGINTAADISNPAYNYWASGRFPFMMNADVTLNCVTRNIRFILVHAKANTSPTATSYDRRKRGADTLYQLLNETYPNDNIIVLGDFNDDLDQSITAGFSISSWNTFVSDEVNYSPLTLPLSLAGKKSTVSYNDVIDHVIVSNEMAAYYMDSTASILTDVSSLVSNYASTTTDHYPVFTRYFFTNSTAPVISDCPAVAAVCENAGGIYTIPSLVATDDCGEVIYSYTITGATERAGNSADASGTFNAGTSIIHWLVKDEQGNTAVCETTVTIHEAPQVTIPDAFALPLGTTGNTVYIGYEPASSIGLTAMVTGGTPGFTYQWSNGSNMLTTTVSPLSTTTYDLTVTDGNGCQATAEKTIEVKDVRGGKKLDKVVICHKPGNINTSLEVSKAAVSAHLDHGDQLGGCGPVPEYPALRVTVAPNPSTSQFVLTIRGGNPEEPVTMKVYNLLGRLVEERRNLYSGQSLQIGQDYRWGLYLVECRQGGEREVLLLLKLK